MKGRNRLFALEGLAPDIKKGDDSNSSDHVLGSIFVFIGLIVDQLVQGFVEFLELGRLGHHLLLHKERRPDLIESFEMSETLSGKRERALPLDSKKSRP